MASQPMLTAGDGVELQVIVNPSDVVPIVPVGPNVPDCDTNRIVPVTVALPVLVVLRLSWLQAYRVMAPEDCAQTTALWAIPFPGTVIHSCNAVGRNPTPVTEVEVPEVVIVPASTNNGMAATYPAWIRVKRT